MRCITFTQPYATLIALGQKRVETRSWSTSYRGPLAIHAAKGLGPVGGKRGLRKLLEQQPFNAALCDVGSNGMIDWWGKDVVEMLPLGAIVAVCRLVDCLPIKIYSIGDSAENGVSYPLPSDPERAFGDYSAGRFAWLLADVKQLKTPIPARGALGLWDWAFDGELEVV